jgi:hypothetical protein
VEDPALSEVERDLLFYPYVLQEQAQPGQPEAIHYIPLQ